MEEMLEADVEDLSAIDGVGEVIATGFYEYFRKEENKKRWEIPTDKQCKRFNFLCLAVLVGTIKRLHVIHLANLGLAAAYRTCIRRRNFRKLNGVQAGQG